MADKAIEARWWRKAEIRAFVLTGLVLLGVYAFTLAPSVNLELGGILIVAADRLGVAITPGQPFWTMLAFLFSRLFGWATFAGHPNPAWGVHWLPKEKTYFSLARLASVR
ncbi:MAG: hypothetical protein MUC65_02505 [Pontiellaceae bacterium]|jgi:hypothetical protein|nr:hypothetical protein [Pontiellaceae bacterium]